MASPSTPLSRTERIRGGVYGLLVGDALGVPYEFSPPNRIPATADIEMSPPAGFRRAHTDVPLGTWSDDGAQALVLLRSLLQDPKLSLQTFSSGLLNWLQAGWMTPDGVVFDIGIQTSAALRRLEEGCPPEVSGPARERDNGNGSLMRCLPCVLVEGADDVELIRLARAQSLPTHGHARSQLACALYALVGRRLLEGIGFDEALQASKQRLRGVTPPHEVRELVELLDGERGLLTGSGYVVDSLWTATECLKRTTDYESCVRAAIAYGNDTDTTACIAGGWAGLLYGEAGIPARWVEALRGREIVEELLSDLSRVAG